MNIIFIWENINTYIQITISIREEEEELSEEEPEEEEQQEKKDLGEVEEEEK